MFRMVMTIALVLCAAGTVPATVSLTRENGKFRMENEALRLTVNPAMGGMVDSFLVKASGRELIGEGCSLLADHFWQQPWPGEFMGAVYQVVVVTNTPEVATLEAACVSKGWSGSTAQNDIRVARRMTLRAGSPLVEVSIRLENTGTVGRVAGYWSQQIFYADGEKQAKQRFFRPTVRGVSEATYESTTGRTAVEGGAPDGFVRDPQQGWMAVLDADSRRGLAFVMRYDELMFLYNCMNHFTTEWQYRSTGIPAGKAWTTDFVFYPVAGLPRVDYASHRLVAAVEPADKDGALTVRVSLAAAAGALEGVTVEGDMLLARQANRPIVPLSTQSCARVESRPAVVTLRAPHDPSEPVAIRLTVKGRVAGRAFEERFDTWYGARYGENRQVDLSPLYPLPVPERHVTFLKPNAIVKTHNVAPRVLFCKGMYADAYLPAATFTALKAEVRPVYFKPTGNFPAALSAFPASYEDLMALDVIVMINVDAVALEGAGEEMLDDFVRHGGTLVYGGDLWAYSRGSLKNGKLSALLPVTFSAGKDKASSLRFLENAQVLRGDTPLAPGAVMAYTAESFGVKADARVLARCGTEPVLVSRSVGQGRVIAITGTTLGEAPQGATLFNRTPAWAELLAEILAGGSTSGIVTGRFDNASITQS
ncbi:MAG: hypothetical protein PHR35_12355 [Kiritimatiellae bacterium]|nr:hypothetical protein [Kiritimatiellia bacterium]